jgi:Cu/Ag efflux protein CusF
MNLKKLALIGSLTLALGVPGWAAQTTTTKSKANPPAATETKTKTTKGAMHRATGTVTSVDNDKLVLNHTVNGKLQDDTIMLNSDTKKPADLKTGDRVSVHWRDENNQKLAAAIKEMPSKAASKPAKSSTKGKS